ncbi:cyclic AMP response element-binding protein A isoform X5 [Dendroctonus ponderosae]|uniref:cyclic AMP response element-binding protein A isoform X5 n=1 Tax=Dendroctonus ponderosae TaxID=77166 RepID=UPI0020362D57|nr:cyclic AMP response element-binding protein A isoform X5 [Dendroctonus ponderosae]
MEMRDVLKLHTGDGGDVEWTFMEAKDIPGIILNDKLMTDAALGTRPIKVEHSYSLSSDSDSVPDSPKSVQKIDVLIDMEDECYPAISMNPSCDRLTDDTMEIKEEEAEIKEEYSETDSIHSSCPSSPHSQIIQGNEIHFDVDMVGTNSQLSEAILQQSGQNILITTPNKVLPQRMQIPQLSLKLAPNGNAFHLPPTPPSCSSSDDSEDNGISQPSSPAARKLTRPLLPYHSRQPIYTPLISTQPKGSTGVLVLTAEEKRTLIAEGYPVPTRLPLTKPEEKSLKKIRRKIKNKISAQESRRKKKEYMDQLERKVDILMSENNDFKRTIENLHESNSDLMAQLQKLQAIVKRIQPHQQGLAK